jgi:hypothetical protein
VPRTQRRPPARDRHEGDVQGLGKVRHAREELGVAREVDAALPFHDEPDGTGPRRHRRAPSEVDGRDGSHGDAADLDLVAGGQLDHRPAEAPQPARGARCRHDGCAGIEPAQRGEVEVVSMRVGDQHGVQRSRVGGLRRPPPQVHDARAQHGIREQPGPGEFEQDRGMAEPREPLGNRPR